MATPDPSRLVVDLMPAVLMAGACLLRIRAEGVTAEEKRDGSPVSRADREAEAIISAALARAAPSVPIIGEEAVSAGSIPGVVDTAFLVDALDGTRDYLRGGDDFTVNIGLVRGGAPVFGMVLAPALGRLFATIAPRQAAQARIPPDRLAENYTPQLTSIATAEPDLAALRIVSSRSIRTTETNEFLKRFSVASDERISSSVKFGLIAAGEADLYPRLGPTSAWDIAAGHAVLVAAGGAVTNLDGKELRYLGKESFSGPKPFLNPSFVAWGRPSLVMAVT